MLLQNWVLACSSWREQQGTSLGLRHRCTPVGAHEPDHFQRRSHRGRYCSAELMQHHFDEPLYFLQRVISLHRITYFVVEATNHHQRYHNLFNPLHVIDTVWVVQRLGGQHNFKPTVRSGKCFSHIALGVLQFTHLTVGGTERQIRLCIILLVQFCHLRQSNERLLNQATFLLKRAELLQSCKNMLVPLVFRCVPKLPNSERFLK
mmetsp:Transcript_384/g.671  ORF Transcript_384/g.671 Transcript_384/m.671 type:complete len:205 (-) Transcript_384:662-1276(-)